VLEESVLYWNCCSVPTVAAWYDRFLPYAPFATAFIALGALVTAIVAICMQTLVARRRAAIDFFLKTDLDHNMLEAHREFRAAVKALKVHLTVGQTVKAFEETQEQAYRHILKYLNIHELVAVGVKNSVFDKDVCFNFWGDVLVHHANEAAAVIDYEIECEGTPSAAFLELRHLSAEWSERTKNWRKRRVQGGDIAHVGGHRTDLGAESAQLLRCRIELFLGAAADCNAGAQGGEVLRHAKIDAAAAAGDEDGLASVEVFREVLGYQQGFLLCLVLRASR
jgi:hypothetical protein